MARASVDDIATKSWAMAGLQRLRAKALNMALLMIVAVISSMASCAGIALSVNELRLAVRYFTLCSH